MHREPPFLPRQGGGVNRRPRETGAVGPTNISAKPVPLRRDRVPPAKPVPLKRDRVRGLEAVKNLDDDR